MAREDSNSLLAWLIDQMARMGLTVNTITTSEPRPASTNAGRSKGLPADQRRLASRRRLPPDSR